MRTGRVSLYDTTISIIEDPYCSGGGLPNGYEQEFTITVFKPLLSYLEKRGFTVSLDPDGKNYKCIAHWMWQATFPVMVHWEATTPVQAANLSARLRLTGRQIEIAFYQNIASEHPAGGYFDSCKFLRMPCSMQQRFLIEARGLIAYLCQAHGYTSPSIDRKPGSHVYSRLRRYCIFGEKTLPTEHPLASFNEHWNMPGDWARGGRFKRDESGWPAPSEHLGYGWNGGNRDIHGDYIEPGSVRYWIDYKGHVLRGRVYPNMNSMSIVVYGPAPRDYTAVNSQELFVPIPGRSLRKVKGWNAAHAIKRLLEGAIQRQDFEKAIIYRDQLKKWQAVSSRTVDDFGKRATKTAKILPAEVCA